ncbi:hypothetical protein TSUD_415530 [Trifolium subterraneum]|uniref:Uncharacterized protein n=1 Tax=Trifolium subterraneum TaxID=3900 RepID=A0A2Z6P5U3_TRISU|nr:hypothetical protein TSUD_415530 [Trifolium subterraneum]
MHVKFDEFEDQPIIHATDDEEDEPVIAQNHDSDENLTSQRPPKTWRIAGYHPPDQIIAIIDESWVEAMKEELHQFEKNEVWNLVPFPKDHSIIGTRWVFRNKLDENGKVVRNKARLVAQGYNQQEGIDYDETFAPVASELEMSMMGELGFFLGLQIKQQDGIFISQEKYINDLLKKYKMNEAKIMSTPMHPSTNLDKYEKGKDVSEKGSHFDLKAYYDADYAGDKIERKSTSGACQFLGEALINLILTTSVAQTKNAGGRKVPRTNNPSVSSSPPRSPSPPKPPTPKSASSSSFETVSESLKSLSEREVSPEIQSSPLPTNMQTTVENPQNSLTTVFQPSQSKSSENSPINLTQNQSQTSSPIESPPPTQIPTNDEKSPSPNAIVPRPKDTPPTLVKIKKSKSFDSSKIRRSSRIMSGAGKKSIVDTTVHVLDPTDSENTLSEREIDDNEMEKATSTKSEPVKAKTSQTPKKKIAETAVKAPRSKKKIDLKKPKGKIWKFHLYSLKKKKFLINTGKPNQLHLQDSFYYHAKVYPDKDLITSHIKGVQLVVDPFVLGDLIGIKSEGVEVYGNDWYDQVKVNKEDLKEDMFTKEGAKKNSPPSSLLKTEFRLLHNMCQHSFFPRTGSKDKVTDLDLLLMYHMAKGIKMNFPYIILHHTIHAAYSGFKKVALPYGMILTRVFRLYYADMNETPFDNHYFTFNIKNVSHMKKELETPVVDTDGNNKTSNDVTPTTDSEKLVTDAAATLQEFNPIPTLPGTTMFSPLMTSSQGSLSSFCTSEFIRNILTSNTPEISTMHVPNPTDSTLPFIPSSFATSESFCSSANAVNAGTKQLMFEGNINFDFPGPSRPAKRSRFETEMEQMRRDLDNVIKGMAVQYSMMDHLILESKSLREWFTFVVCPQLHITPPPEIAKPHFDPFLHQITTLMMMFIPLLHVFTCS